MNPVPPHPCTLPSCPTCGRISALAGTLTQSICLLRIGAKLRELARWEAYAERNRYVDNLGEAERADRKIARLRARLASLGHHLPSFLVDPMAGPDRVR